MDVQGHKKHSYFYPFVTNKVVKHFNWNSSLLVHKMGLTGALNLHCTHVKRSYSITASFYGITGINIIIIILVFCLCPFRPAVNGIKMGENVAYEQVFVPEQTCLELHPIIIQEVVHNDICNNSVGV